eukprot:CAMPEP_0114581990 /NCGR_PEP_ID=MMETSP0125-20121206/6035_1 /TAXON_ID=485358 ORGANISM="Aristerostoma sp., Strain ATCC 50986" /NCGR_SAMPLE_ID=MMETSP0125 /ASSEMBLY_ACC=CAM_ASM_000245 /LENGTH=36 /DNA_ID= /DNA_START= /DNA_END= /DNA_ORIENTATION=
MEERERDEIFQDVYRNDEDEEDPDEEEHQEEDATRK